MGVVELGLAAEPGLLTARIRAAPEQLAIIGRLLAELSPSASTTGSSCASYGRSWTWSDR